MMRGVHDGTAHKETAPHYAGHFHLVRPRAGRTPMRPAHPPEVAPYFGVMLASSISSGYE